MKQKTLSRMEQFENFLKTIDSFYRDNGIYFWLTLKKETYISDVEKIKNKVSELELDNIEVGEPEENLLTVETKYSLEIRRK